MCVGFGLACGGFWSSVVVAGYEKRTIRVLPLVVLLCFTCSGGGVLLSHTLPGAVPLPCWVLASGFGMGPGVSPRP